MMLESNHYYAYSYRSLRVPLLLIIAVSFLVRRLVIPPQQERSDYDVVVDALLLAAPSSSAAVRSSPVVGFGGDTPSSRRRSRRQFTKDSARIRSTSYYSRLCSGSQRRQAHDGDESDDGNGSSSSDSNISARGVYFDMEVDKTPIGRLVFELSDPSRLPLHTENLVRLARGNRYARCRFDYTPASVEDVVGAAGRYRWGHVCKGPGMNALAPYNQPITDPASQLAATHSCYGGQYYGDPYIEYDEDEAGDDPGVFLTVQVKGPGYGTSRFSIVRVGESPQEWKERLLINSGVIGRLRPESLDTLHRMARQQQGPPTIVASGTIEDEDDDG